MQTLVKLMKKTYSDLPVVTQIAKRTCPHCNTTFKASTKLIFSIENGKPHYEHCNQCKYSTEGKKHVI